MAFMRGRISTPYSRDGSLYSSSDSLNRLYEEFAGNKVLHGHADSGGHGGGGGGNAWGLAQLRVSAVLLAVMVVGFLALLAARASNLAVGQRFAYDPVAAVNTELDLPPLEAPPDSQLDSPPPPSSGGGSSGGGGGGHVEDYFHAEPDAVGSDEFAALSRRTPECSRRLPLAKSFLMVMASHTGSTALSSVIRMTDGVWYDYGTYEPLNRRGFVDNFSRSAIWTRELFRNWTTHGDGRLIGFKLMSPPILSESDIFSRLVSDFDTRVVWSYRYNSMKRAVGRYLFDFHNDNTAVSGVGVGEKFDDTPFRVDSLDDLHCSLTRIRRTDRDMRDAVSVLTSRSVPNCALHVPYEDFLRYPTLVTYQIQDFLGLRRMNISSLRVKVTCDNLCKVVSNYGDLCAAFGECSAWSWMLHDPENECSCENYAYTSMGGDGVNRYCGVEADPEGSHWCGIW